MTDTPPDASTDRRTTTRFAITGLLLAVAYLSRFPLLVLLIAAAMTLVIANGLGKRGLSAVVPVLAGFVIVNVAYHGVIRTVYDVRLPARSIAGNLLVGVNVEGGGGWNEPDWRRLISFPTMESASAWAMRESIDRLRARPAEIAGLMVRKAAVYWRTDEYGVLWGVERSVPPDVTAAYLRPLYRAANLFHAAVMLLAMCGAVWLVFRGARDPRLNLILLPLLGGTLLHSVLEVQSRYHYPFMPLVFVVSAIGASNLIERGSARRMSDSPR